MFTKQQVSSNNLIKNHASTKQWFYFPIPDSKETFSLLPYVEQIGCSIPQAIEADLQASAQACALRQHIKVTSNNTFTISETDFILAENKAAQIIEGSVTRSFVYKKISGQAL